LPGLPIGWVEIAIFGAVPLIVFALGLVVRWVLLGFQPKKQED
jgi:hypothetical protein